jgi:hypothetical protein
MTSGTPGAHAAPSLPPHNSTTLSLYVACGRINYTQTGSKEGLEQYARNSLVRTTHMPQLAVTSDGDSRFIRFLALTSFSLH